MCFNATFGGHLKGNEGRWERGSGDVSWTDSKNPLMASGSCPGTQWPSNVPTFPVIHVIVQQRSGVLVRELQHCCVLSTLLIEKTLNKKCPVISVSNVLTIKGLDVVVSSDGLNDVDLMPVGQGSAMGSIQPNQCVRGLFVSWSKPVESLADHPL